MEPAALELNGSGSGYGSGSGDGSGDGSGYSDGSGDGSGSKDYFAALLAPFAVPDAVVAFWRSNSDGTPANGGSMPPAAVGLTQEVPGPLRLCGPNALHATLDPGAWKGDRWWVVALHRPVIEQEDKLGSLKRTIVADLGPCPF